MLQDKHLNKKVRNELLEKSSAAISAAVGKNDARAVRELLENDAKMGSPAQKTDGTKWLHQAVMQHSPATVAALLTSPHIKASIDAASITGDTAMQMVCAKGMATVADVLLGAGASIAIQNKLGQTALYLAVLRGDNKIFFTLQKNIDAAVINVPDQNGRTPLHAATETGRVAIAVTLLARGASSIAYDRYGRTPLMGATKRNTTEICSAILAQNPGHAYINAVDNMERTALHMACSSETGNTPIMLLGAGADPRIQDMEGQTPLMYAVAAGLEFTTAILLSHPDVVRTINMLDKAGNSAILLAMKRNNTQQLQRLITEGASVLARNNKGMTAMMWALAAKNEEVAMWLSSRADFVRSLTVFDNAGWSVAHYAAANNSTKLLSRIDETHPAMLGGLDKDLNTPLARALLSKMPECVDVILATEVGKREINKVNVYGEMALSIALRMASGKTIGALLGAGASVDIPNGEGDMPLAIAASRGNLPIAAYLLSNERCRATIDHRNRAGQTALHQACLKKDTQVISALLDAGASADIPDNKGNTALHYAVRLVITPDMCAGMKSVINVRNFDGDTPLHLALRTDHSQNVRKLKSNKADFLVVNNAGEVPLAALSKKAAAKTFGTWDWRDLFRGICKELMEKADLDERICGQLTLPMLIAQNGSRELLEEVLDYEWDRTRLSGAGESILVCLMKGVPQDDENAAKLGRLLLKDNDIRESINQRDHSGNAALHYALRCKNEALARSILATRGCKAGLVNDHNQSPVLLACKLALPTTAKLLLSRKMAKSVIDLAEDEDNRTALHYAAETDQGDILELLLDLQATPTLLTYSGYSATGLAIKAGAIDIVRKMLDRLDQVPDEKRDWPAGHSVWDISFSKKDQRPEQVEMTGLLLDHGFDPMTEGINGSNALQLAVTAQATGVVKLLLANSAVCEQINATHSKSGSTALALAIEADQPEIAALLLDAGADPSLTDKAGNSVLMAAIPKATDEFLISLLTNEKVQAQINHRRHDGHTAFTLLGQRDGDSMIEVLLQAGADPNRAGARMQTLFHSAIIRGQRHIVQKLMTLKTMQQIRLDVDTVDETGARPVTHTVKTGDFPQFQLLIHAGASSVVPLQSGQTLLMQAAQAGQVHIVEQLLLDANVKSVLDERDPEGRTAFHIACRYQQTEIAQILLAAGAVPLTTDAIGNSTLHDVAAGNRPALLRLLLARPDVTGIINQKGLRGETPLMSALKSRTGQAESALLLIEHEADPLIADDKGVLPLTKLAALPAGAARNKLLQLVLERSDVRRGLHQSDASGMSALQHLMDKAPDPLLNYLLETPEVDLEATTGKGENLLMLAATRKTGNILASLLLQPFWKARLEATDKQGRTALLQVAENGPPHNLVVLIKAGALTTALSNQNDNLLSCAVKGKLASLVERLLRLPGVAESVNVPNEDGVVALHHAVYADSEPIVSLLLKYGADPLWKANNGISPLASAITRARSAVEHLLIAAIPAEQFQNPIPIGEVPMPHALIAAKKLKLLHRLKERSRVQLTTLDDKGETPLFAGVRHGMPGDVEWLLQWPEVQENLNRPNKAGETVIHEAARLGKTAILAILLSRGARAGLRSVQGDTPLIVAIQQGHMAAVKCLLAIPEVEETIHVANAEGDTALHKAMFARRDKIVRNLLDIETIRQPILEAIADPAVDVPLIQAGAPSLAEAVRATLTVAERGDPWRIASFRDRQMAVLYYWAAQPRPAMPEMPGLHVESGSAGEASPVIEAALAAYRRQTRIDLRKRAQINLRLGQLLAQEENRARAQNRTDLSAEKRQTAAFRLLLALELMFKSAAPTADISECAGLLLEAAPGRHSFRFNGTHIGRNDLEELRNGHGDLLLEAAIGYGGVTVEERHEGLQAHSSTALMLGRKAMDTMRDHVTARRIALRQDNPAALTELRHPVTTEVIAALRTLPLTQPFSNVFKTGIYWEYERGLRRHKDLLANYLEIESGPDDTDTDAALQALDLLAATLQKEVLTLSLETTRSHYHWSPDPNLIAVTAAELRERREFPEIMRIMRHIKLELRIRPAIEQQLAMHVFETETEAVTQLGISHQQVKDVALTRNNNPGLSAWITEHHPGKTMRNLAEFGLAHIFSKSRPVQDTEMPGDTHTSVALIFDYITSKTDKALYNRLMTSFADKLLDIGNDPMCNTVCVGKIMTTASYADPDFSTSVLSADGLREVISEQDALDEDLFEDIDEIIDTNDSIGRELRKKLGLDEKLISALHAADSTLSGVATEATSWMADVREELMKLATDLRNAPATATRSEITTFLKRIEALRTRLQLKVNPDQDVSVQAVLEAVVQPDGDWKMLLHARRQATQNSANRLLSSVAEHVRQMQDPHVRQLEKVKTAFANHEATRQIDSAAAVLKKQMLQQGVTSLLARRRLNLAEGVLLNEEVEAYVDMRYNDRR